MTRLGLTTGVNRFHMTDEAHQLFLGLQHAGYQLVGYDMPDPELDIMKLLDRYSPGTIVVQDKREWDGLTAGGRSNNPDMKFIGVRELAAHPDVFRVTILKDAQNNPQYHRASAEEMGAHAWVVYYHPRIVSHVAPYVRPQHLIRTYHTVDTTQVPLYSPEGRRGALLSGAVSNAYPLRSALVRGASQLPDCDVLPHPGYHRAGCQTPAFLQTLSRYKVAVCTSSRYGYLLRKIVEATACGCIVLTDLPSDEVVPEIDEGLVRITPDFSPRRVGNILRELYASYNPEKQRYLAEKAKAFYDYRSAGMRLANDIESLRKRYGAGEPQCHPH